MLDSSPSTLCCSLCTHFPPLRKFPFTFMHKQALNVHYICWRNKFQNSTSTSFPCLPNVEGLYSLCVHNSLTVLLTQWFTSRHDFASQDHLKMSGDSFGWHTGGMLLASAGRVRDVAEHSAQPRVVPHNKEISNLNISCAKVEKYGLAELRVWNSPLGAICLLH